MGSYLSNTDAQRREMLAAMGVNSLEDLYSAIPADLMLTDGPALPQGKSELAVSRKMTGLSHRNTVFPTIFRGGGAYRHFIPSIVKSVVSKEAFRTAYTPYQPEISQGILQAIFEYQTMICQLTGMDVANASVYDGATAAAEAVAMCRDRKRVKALVSVTTQPDVIETIRTYCWSAGAELALIPMKDGITDMERLEAMLDDSVACVYVQQPNFFGMLEEAEAIGKLTRERGAKYIMGVNPIAMALLKTPGECGADIAVGEGQPLGIPLSFGGPYLGFMAAKSDLVRKLPGRIAGETVDGEGNRAFVLTLQAREQHIRREKASSNICSNQALCALTASVYLAAMGPEGLRDAAEQCAAKAHYLARELEKLGFRLKYDGDFFHEFLTTCPEGIDGPEGIDNMMAVLEANGILGGLPADGGILWCATEMNTKQEMDRMIELLRSILNGAQPRQGKAREEGERHEAAV